MSKRVLKQPRWRVIRLKKTPVAEVGTVEAATAEEAIERAIEKFGVKPDHQGRLAAYRWR